MKRIVILLLLICLAKFAGAQILKRSGSRGLPAPTAAPVAAGTCPVPAKI